MAWTDWLVLWIVLLVLALLFMAGAGRLNERYDKGSPVRRAPR